MAEEIYGNKYFTVFDLGMEWFPYAENSFFQQQVLVH